MNQETHDPGSVLVQYTAGPDQLEAAVAGLTDAQLDLALTAGTWTIRSGGPNATPCRSASAT
jgi:hypothetical protein